MAEEAKAVLRLEGISKSFGGLRVLQDVDIVVHRDEIVGLIGPNGAGKSTVFNLITSLYPPDHGRIYFLGRDITRMAPHRICRMGIARTYQLVRVFLKLSVLENVMVATVYGRPRGQAKEARATAMETLEALRLSHLAHAKASQLTLSDRRRLEIAMALASAPLLVLLDEPMAGLTPAEIDDLVGLIKELRRERKFSVMWVEHRVDAVFDHCDRIIVLDHGVKIAEGPPEAVANDPKVIEVYLGESAA